jgi:hypothetical protein
VFRPSGIFELFGTFKAREIFRKHGSVTFIWGTYVVEDVTIFELL